MQPGITILISELSEMHPAYQPRATSNTLHHILNHRARRIVTVAEKDGEWCEVRSAGSFQFEFDPTRFFNRSSCLKHVLAQRNIQYNETPENEETGTLLTKSSQRDEFGFLISSKTYLFLEQMSAAGNAGITMNDVRNAEWNSKKSDFYEAVRKLVNEGRIIKKDSRMYWLAAMGQEPIAPVKSKPHPVAAPTKVKPVPVAGKRKLRPVAV